MVEGAVDEERKYIYIMCVRVCSSSIVFLCIVCRGV